MTARDRMCQGLSNVLPLYDLGADRTLLSALKTESSVFTNPNVASKQTPSSMLQPTTGIHTCAPAVVKACFEAKPSLPGSPSKVFV